jgi:hypothetical protein
MSNKENEAQENDFAKKMGEFAEEARQIKIELQNINLQNEVVKLQSALTASQKEVERLRAENEWIPVSERLPEAGEVVLTYSEWGSTLVCFVDVNGRWRVNFNSSLHPCITHYMKLPEPPKPFILKTSKRN